MSEGRAVAITGANGYVGSVLRAAFLTAGYEVIVLQRSVPPAESVAQHIPYALENGLAAPLPRGVAAVVHCAYDLHSREPSDIERINYGGTEVLLKSVKDVPVVLISSMSAYSGTRQIYGKTKLRCEDLVSAHGGTSLRLGLVYGHDAGGMVGALEKVSQLPLVPLLRPDSYQYTVHVDDMARCVVSTVARPSVDRIVGVAHPERVPFSEIVRTLHTASTTKPLRAVPVPSALVYGGLRLVEAAGVRAGFRADSMLGLMHPAPNVPNVALWAERGIVLRKWGVHTSSG